MSVLTVDLKPHLALVTGASGGIGKATCLALASMGCSIAVHYHSSTSAAEELVKQLKEKGVRAEAFKADLTKYDEVCRCKCSASARALLRFSYLQRVD
jgi:3-oxoacyl-[acyl-carrier protein] reductase